MFSSPPLTDSKIQEKSSKENIWQLIERIGFLLGGWLNFFLSKNRRSPLSPKFWILVLLAICIISFELREKRIAESLPYPHHVDEVHIMKPALHILSTGNYHPSRFQYPALPTYLAAGSMAIGLMRSAAKRGIHTVEKIGRVSYPYYTNSSIVNVTKKFFALLSILALAATGVAGFYLLGRPSALALMPLILTLSPFFFSMSQKYVNVDIVGTCFVILGLAATLKGSRRPSLRWLVVIPAICAGLAAGSKYPCGLLLLPTLIGIWLFMTRGRRIDASIIAVVTAAAAFLAVAPYTLIDLPGFLNGFVFEIYHYSFGHGIGSQNEPPGLAQFMRYGRHLTKDVGSIALFIALVGFFTAAKSDWRRTLVLVSFLTILIVLLSLQRTHFSRNILPAYPCIAILIGMGLYSIHRWLMKGLCKKWNFSPRFHKPVSAMIFSALFVLGLSHPLSTFSYDQIQVRLESRREAVEWIKEHLSTNQTIIIPTEFKLDARPLKALGYSIRMEEFLSLDTGEAIRGIIKKESNPVVVLIPKWSGKKANSPGADLAMTLNQAITEASLKSLKTFPGYNLKTDHWKFAPYGNPSINISIP